MSAAGIEVLSVPPGGIAVPDEVPLPVTATGGVGIVTVELNAGEVLFSPDGANWSTTSLPPDMAQANSWGWFTASGAATDEVVLMLLFDDTTGEQQPSWWLGTLP